MPLSSRMRVRLLLATAGAPATDPGGRFFTSAALGRLRLRGLRPRLAAGAARPCAGGLLLGLVAAPRKPRLLCKSSSQAGHHSSDAPRTGPRGIPGPALVALLLRAPDLTSARLPAPRSPAPPTSPSASAAGPPASPCPAGPGSPPLTLDTSPAS